MKLFHYVVCSLCRQRRFHAATLYSSQLPCALQQLCVFKLKLGNCFIAGLTLHIDVLISQTECLYCGWHGFLLLQMQHSACLVVRDMSGVWVNHRNHLAGVLDTQSSCLPLGEPETYVSISYDMGLDELSHWAQTQVQPGTEWKVLLRQNSFIKGKKEKKKIKYSLQLLMKYCFTAVIPSLCELRLGTEKTLLMDVLFSPPFFTVLVCGHVLCSFSLFFFFFPPLSPVSTLSPQDILNSGLQRLFLLSWLSAPFAGWLSMY